MTTVGNLNVRMSLDDSELKKGMLGAKNKTKAFGSNIATQFAKAGKAIAKALVAGTLIAGVAILALGKKALSTASDLEEVANVVSTTFGEMTDDVNRFAETAAVNFGLSELAAKQFASQIGSILTPTGLGTEAIADMSVSLTKLSGDMGSFFNVASEDAFGALRAGIIGETEPLKRFGIVMTQANLNAFALAEGMDKTVQSMSQAELATLRYNFILDATSKVQGDFEKTSESLANQQRIFQLNVENLAAAFGEVLLPVASNALLEINQKIEDIFPNLKFLADSLGGLFSKETVDTENVVNEFDELGNAFGRIQPGPEAEDRFKMAAQNIVKILVSSFTDAFPEIVKTISSGMPGIITAIITGILSVVPKMAGVSIKIITALVNGIVTAAPILAEQIPIILTTILSAIVENVPFLIDAGIQIIMSLIEGIVSAVPILAVQIPLLILNILDSVLEALPVFIEAGISIISSIVEGVLSAAPFIISVIAQTIPKLISAISEQLPSIIEAAIQIVLALIEGIVSAIPVFVSVMPKLIKQLLEVLTDLLPLIIDGAISIVFALLDGIVVALPLLVDGAIKIILALIDGITKALPLLTEAIPKIIDAIVATIEELLPTIVDAAVLLVTTLAEAMVAEDLVILEAVVTIGLSIITAIAKLLPDIIKAGADLIGGLISGMLSVDTSGGLSKLAGSVVSGFKNVFESKSPSKLIQREVGEDVGEGVIPDVQMLPSLQRKMREVANAITRGGASGVQAANQNDDQGSGQLLPQSPVTDSVNINQFIVLAENVIRQISQEEAEQITNMALTEVAE